MTLAHVLGFPRIGAQRELTTAMASFRQGACDEAALRATGRQLRARHWRAQAAAGMDYVTVGDFAWHDHVLSTLALLGAVPSRFCLDAARLGLDDYDNMACGGAHHCAMETAQWFDTRYHYLVPEWTPDLSFDGGVDWLFDDIDEAQALGFAIKVVLLGPLSLLYLGKCKSGLSHQLALLPQVLAGYEKLLRRLRDGGVALVQIDEPILAYELTPEWRDAFLPVYAALAAAGPEMLLATYFDTVSDYADLLCALPVAGIHLDGVSGAKQLQAFASHWPQDKILSVGIVDGRNVWRCDLDAALATLKPLHAMLGERLWVASSCSLLHVPVDLANEPALDEELKAWLAFAMQKLDEIALLKRALVLGDDAVAGKFAVARTALASRRSSSRRRNALVQQRLQAVSDKEARRPSAFNSRNARQQERWNLPLFPTTTISAFPHAPHISQLRAAYRCGALGHLDYLVKMREEIGRAVARQEALGLDVLVHGAPERDDMIDYFGEQLWGYAFTVNGWVQHCGVQCVKPPLIYGDVYRPEAMTVGWSRFAQQLTQKPMKGMLTGPVTLLQWSFVRDDQPRDITALQIALALRDEVCDLEQAGIGMIQIDEPALREGMPLKARHRQHYLDWAIRAFRLSAAAVSDETQIHTHLRYSAIGAILPWIAAMDADVVTIEPPPSGALSEDVDGTDGPNERGADVLDMPPSRVLTVQDMVRRLEKTRSVIGDRRLWINPDCGLTARNWPEAREFLRNLVQAARQLRDTDQRGADSALAAPARQAVASLLDGDAVGV